jgi:hypothetical protein
MRATEERRAKEEGQRGRRKVKEGRRAESTYRTEEDEGANEGNPKPALGTVSRT